MAAGRPRAASPLLGSSGTSTRDIIAEAGLSKKQHLKSKLQFDRLTWLGMSGSSRVFPKFESYGAVGMPAFCGQKSQDYNRPESWNIDRFLMCPALLGPLSFGEDGAAGPNGPAMAAKVFLCYRRNQGGIRTNTVGKKHRCTKCNRCIQYRLVR